MLFVQANGSRAEGALFSRNQEKNALTHCWTNYLRNVEAGVLAPAEQASMATGADNPDLRGLLVPVIRHAIEDQPKVPMVAGLEWVSRD